MSTYSLNYSVCVDTQRYNDDGSVRGHAWVDIAFCRNAKDAERIAMGLSALEKTRFYVRLSGEDPHISYYQLDSKNERPYGVYANEQL